MPARPSPYGMPPNLAARTRRERANALLTLPDSAIFELTSPATLNDKLSPFRRRFDLATAAFDRVAFIHGFGVVGPSRADWDALFAASEGLMAEDVAVCVAFAVTGGLCVFMEGKRECQLRAQWRSMFEEVLLGPEDAPGILDRVCDLFDEWVVTGAGILQQVSAAAEAEALRWYLERVEDGLYIWRGGGGGTTGEGDDLRVAEFALGDGMKVCAGKIAMRETRRVLEVALRRVSLDGVGMAVERVRRGGQGLMEVAKQSAEGVLVCRVFECMGVPMAV